MEKAELQLTKEAIANEGIDIKLSQADVIDMLVEEQLESIDDIYKKLNQIDNDLAIAAKKEVDDAIAKIVAKQITPKGLEIVGHPWSILNQSNAKPLTTIRKSIETRFGVIHYRKVTSNLYGTIEGYITLKYAGTIEGVKLEGSSEPIPFKFKYSKKLMDLFAEQNVKIEEFLAMLPDSGINEKEITRKIKNKFTKEILKTSSPDFRKKLKEGFAIDL